MKILMIGLGSIGQRHLRNLRHLFGNQIEIISYRVRGHSHTFSNDLTIRHGINLEQEYNVTSFHNLEIALAESPDIAFITNITSAHIPCALAAAQAGCDLFLEKPLSHNMDGIQDLLSIVNKKKLLAAMGFQNRYHVVLQAIKKYLEQGTLGSIISVDVEMGENLKTMHSYEDYTTTYMAHQTMGGGVVLNQQIHELDYIQWLFGQPTQVYSMGGNSGCLNIDVEDHCVSTYSIPQNGGFLPVCARADFFQIPPSRKCKIVGEKGIIIGDLLNAHLSVTYNGKAPQEYEFPQFQRNDMFLNELHDFMLCIKERRPPHVSLAEGIVSLKMALAAKDSMRKHQPVFLDQIN